MTRHSLPTVAGLSLTLSIGLISGCQVGQPKPILSAEDRETLPTLWVGDRAPTPAIREWVKGEPVRDFEPGTVYVLKFWATWCAPCMASMQHTSRIAEKFGGEVVVLAVSDAGPANSRAEIRREARDPDNHMNFRVAIDDRGRTTERYLRAARIGAIPRCVVIDANGRIAWIGHPLDLEPPLTQIVAGTWDLPGSGIAYGHGAGTEARKWDLFQNMNVLRESGHPDEQLDIYRQLASIENEWLVSQVWSLVRAGRHDEAVTAAEVGLLQGDFESESEITAALARALIDVAPEYADELAERAFDLLIRDDRAAGEPTDDMWERYIRYAMWTRRATAYASLAEVRAKQERFTEAVELQRLAVERIPKGRPDRANLERRLAEYESLAQHAAATAPTP